MHIYHNKNIRKTAIKAYAQLMTLTTGNNLNIPSKGLTWIANQIPESDSHTPTTRPGTNLMTV
jgi:hypothetical protein